MQTTKLNLKTKRSQRTAAILAVETDLVRRFHTFLDGWTKTDAGHDSISNEMAQIGDFIDSFVDCFHLLRVETVLSKCGKAGDRRLELWLGKLAVYQDKLRDRLEGMQRALASNHPGAPTAFRWAAAALARELDHYLFWAEHGLLPELRVRITGKLDRELISALELDEANEVSLYAQAESLILSLESTL